MIKLTGSVGNNGQNRISDVQAVQELLNQNIKNLFPLLPLKVDGRCGPVTIGLITEFQKRCVGLKRPDGRVDPGGQTLRLLVERKPDPSSKVSASVFSSNLLSIQKLNRRSPSSANSMLHEKKSVGLTEADYKRAAGLLSVEVATVKAVASVESQGGGFLTNGKPKILFEGHWFSKLTNSQYDKSHPSISYKAWTKKHYLGGASEYKRYEAAFALNKEAAMKSTSWGSFQIMGFNHKRCGYPTVEQFVKDMYRSEGHQLNAFVNFLKSGKLDCYLKAKSWAAFAKRYNGPRYAENAYDTKLKQAYEAFASK